MTMGQGCTLYIRFCLGWMRCTVECNSYCIVHDDMFNLVVIMHSVLQGHVDIRTSGSQPDWLTCT